MTRGRPRRQHPARWRRRFLRVFAVGALVVGVVAWRERKFSENQQRWGPT